MALYDLLIEQIENTNDFTERLALKIAAGILAQRVSTTKPDLTVQLTKEETDWTPEKIEMTNGVIPWPTPELHAQDYDMTEDYASADEVRQKAIRKLLQDPTDEMRRLSEAKWEAKWRSRQDE
jgi:hypothetical protein